MYKRYFILLISSLILLNTSLYTCYDFETGRYYKTQKTNSNGYLLFIEHTNEEDCIWWNQKCITSLGDSEDSQAIAKLLWIYNNQYTFRKDTISAILQCINKGMPFENIDNSMVSLYPWPLEYALATILSHSRDIIKALLLRGINPHYDMNKRGLTLRKYINHNHSSLGTEWSFDELIAELKAEQQKIF